VPEPAPRDDEAWRRHLYEEHRRGRATPRRRASLRAASRRSPWRTRDLCGATL